MPACVYENEQLEHAVEQKHERRCATDTFHIVFLRKCAEITIIDVMIS